MKFAVVLHTDDGEHYGVTVPDLPGCFSAGDSMEEALDMAVEAIDGHLELLFEENGSIPERRPIKEHQQNPDFDAGVWALVDVDVTSYLGKSERFNITMPHLLVKRIDEYVATHKDAGSRSGFLQKAAAKELGLS
ncbi:MAG: type II toxin-antitoxin system HicB family antitoxin [Reinekea sp.]